MLPHSHYIAPDKARLLDEFKNLKVSDLPVPSLLIDKKKFINNSTRMLLGAKALGVNFRVHIKTHKALEGVRIQLQGDGSYTSDKIVVSTLPEAYMVLPLVDEGIVKDILYGLPVSKLMLPEFARFQSLVPSFKLMVDNISQVNALKEYAAENGCKWTVYVKIDMGTHRAGLEENTEKLHSLIREILSTATIILHGFYCHAGHSYDARSGDDARALLVSEIKHANLAAKQALAVDPSLQLLLSVGATPTAHISQQVKSIREIEDALGEKLVGNLELHAGNYSCCDLQQVATGLVDLEDVSIYVLAEVISEYPGRGNIPPGEQLINAGGIAFSKDTGPLPGYGRIVAPVEHREWHVARVSQEHGVLQPLSQRAHFIPYGTKLVIVPQHACMTASNHAWYYVIENDIVTDVWIPAKLW